MNTSVSVIIPIYNRTEFVLKTISSILSQTCPPEEIIAVDDGSSVDMPEVKNHPHPKVKYHRISNSGVCAARNTGVLLASSSYIAFCDSDDLWRSDKLAKQMTLHEHFPNLGYSFTNFSTVSNDNWASTSKFDDAPANFFADSSRLDEACLIFDSPIYDRIIQFQPIFPSTILMKKSFFQELGGFNESFGKNPSEDLEFTLRCVQHAPIGVVYEPVVGIRKHAMNFSGNNYATSVGRIDIFRYALEHHSVSDSTKSLLQKQIITNQVIASHDAFALGDFDACRELLSGIPTQYLTPKIMMKLLISKCPNQFAAFLRRLLVSSVEQ